MTWEALQQDMPILVTPKYSKILGQARKGRRQGGSEGLSRRTLIFAQVSAICGLQCLSSSPYSLPAYQPDIMHIVYKCMPITYSLTNI